MTTAMLECFKSYDKSNPICHGCAMGVDCHYETAIHQADVWIKIIQKMSQDPQLKDRVSPEEVRIISLLWTRIIQLDLERGIRINTAQEQSTTR